MSMTETTLTTKDYYFNNYFEKGEFKKLEKSSHRLILVNGKPSQLSTDVDGNNIMTYP
jgi:hypothetical protein